MTARKTKAPPAKRKAASRKKTPPRSPARKRSRRKPPPGEPDPGGRPAIEWDEGAAADVHRMSRAGNTVEDMAAILAVSKRALEEAIANVEIVAEAYRLGRAERRDVLRTAQLRAALRGNATMLIWLGKQDLGQRDVKAVELGGPGGEPIAFQAELGPVVKQKLREYLRSKGKTPEEVSE